MVWVVADGRAVRTPQTSSWVMMFFEPRTCAPVLSSSARRAGMFFDAQLRQDSASMEARPAGIFLLLWAPAPIAPAKSHWITSSATARTCERTAPDTCISVTILASIRTVA